MTDLHERIAALSPEKRSLFETRLAALAASGSAPAYERLRPRDRSEPSPLGVAQQREWAIGRFRAANNISGVLRLEGALDLALLERALSEILDRHEVLRSTVEIGADATPVQIVQQAGPVRIPVVDLSHLTSAQQDAEVSRVHAAEQTCSFDPTDPQRLRVTVLRLGDDVHAAVFATDHAASDAWSLSIIVQEVAALYALFQDPAAPRLPRPEIQFGDFAVWQRQRLDADRVAAELRFWRETLAGMPTGWALPADRPYPAHPTYAGSAHTAHLSAEETAEVRRFSEAENASLFTVLLAACTVLLSRYLGQDDLVIGSLVSGRTRLETEQLIGCLANPVPLRMRLRDDMTLREVVRQARDTMSTALDHQALPFDLLSEELGIGRESVRTSLSPVWINVLSVPDATVELAGLRVTPLPIEPAQTSVDLTLNVMPGGDRLLMQWHYMTELFDADTVAVLSDQFRRVLHHVVTAPDTQVWAVDLATAAPAPRVHSGTVTGTGFIEMFERRVTLAPHAPALIFDGAETSYIELNRQANELAHHLRGLGVGPDTRVAILVDRSPRMATAILGVLKAGGCYVPLDPGYPAERLAYMLSDAEVALIVTEQRMARVLDAANRALSLRTVLLDELQPQHGDTERNLPDTPEPDSLAYVVYTSGSTGRPKGAMIEHQSLAVFARDIAERLGLGAGDRFLQFASPSFDVLVEELFPVWSVGGAVVIPARHIISGDDDLVALAERERLTVMELPTAYWHEWTRELHRLRRDLPQGLRLVIIGGERVLPERLAMWRRTGVPLMHVYGLTEATVSSTFFRLDPSDPVDDWPNLPIGSAIPSADLRVLDRRLQPVPDGGIGELYIGGVSLARGYLGRPGLTAGRFVADPSVPGERLYRTGDLVRPRPDGNLEFISRVDTQISIRGFRVEPAEVESALTAHPDVAEAVVTAFEPTAGNRRLVAYVVPVPGAAPNAGDLRSFLELALPAYQIPSTFLELDALPLSANGKIDRARLPRPDGSSQAQPSEEYVPPQSSVQEKLVQIVAAVVGVSRIGINDNFFEIGGDSILAIQVVARALEAGLKLSPYELFAHPTVAALAEVVVGGQTIDADQAEVTGPVPLIPSQRRFCGAAGTRPVRWNTSVLLVLSTVIEPDLLERAVELILRHHDGLRQRFLLNADRTRARIAPPGGQTPFEIHDLSGLDAAYQDRQIPGLLAQLQASLDPAVGPLLRVALVRLGGGRPDRLAVVASRLVADVPSVRIVVEDLETAMVQLSAAEKLRFLPKTTSWQSWARRIASYADSDEIASQRDYWTDIVGGDRGLLPPDLEPTALADTEASTRTAVAALERAETDELLRTVPLALDCRVDELLLAALARVLTGWTSCGRHVIDLERQDRQPLYDDVDLSRTVGCFSRIHPVALSCDPTSPPEQTLITIRDSLRAVPTAGLGWGMLAAASGSVASSGAQLAFSYAGPAPEPASGAFAVADETVGGDRHADDPRPYPIEVQATVIRGVLELRWHYSAGRHLDETMNHLASCHLDEVRKLISAARRADSARTSADFPLARIDQGQLDELLSRLASG